MTYSQFVLEQISLLINTRMTENRQYFKLLSVMYKVMTSLFKLRSILRGETITVIKRKYWGKEKGGRIIESQKDMFILFNPIYKTTSIVSQTQVNWCPLYKLFTLIWSNFIPNKHFNVYILLSIYNGNNEIKPLFIYKLFQMQTCIYTWNYVVYLWCILHLWPCFVFTRKWINILWLLFTSRWFLVSFVVPFLTLSSKD